MSYERLVGSRLYLPDPNDGKFPLEQIIDHRLKRRPYRYYRAGPTLDQGAVVCPNGDHVWRCGTQGFCVGMAWRQWLSSAPIMTREKIGFSGLDIYHHAQEYDDFGGVEYSGSTVRGGAQALQKVWNVIESYHWAQSLDEILDFILTDCGTIVVGTNWYSGMMEPEIKYKMPFIRPVGRTIGGHAYLIVGAHLAGERLRILNSWGPEWGENGRAWITFEDFERLLSEDGEAAAAVEKKEEKEVVYYPL